MIPVPETVINEDTVMIEFLNAPIAEITMVGVFRPQSFTRNANVIKMIVLFDQFVEEL